MTRSFFSRGFAWVCPLACIATLFAGCPKANPKAGSCTKSSECRSGQECSAGTCVAAPCGGTCTADQLCENNLCVAADGVNCSKNASICPAGYTCETSTGECQRQCTLDSNCSTPGYTVCNVNQFVCAQCAVNDDCSSGPYGAKGLDVCNANGLCVACLQDSDCDVDSMPDDMYCDTASQSCKPGCLSVNDCPPGTLSCTGSSTTPGICVECTGDDNCVSTPDTPVCNTTTSQCVACLTNSDCSATTNQCDTSTNLCVECVEDSYCPLGQFCTSDACANGCTDNSNCPPDAPTCDPSQEANGTCVACIVGDNDCPPAQICVQQGSSAACVPGCMTDDTCQGAPNMDDFCDPTEGLNGTCVQCLRDSQCPTNQFCDTTTDSCRCHGTGESCTTSADCGYEDVGGTPDCNALGAACINVVRCGASDDHTYQIIDQICTQAASAGLPDQCPAQSAGSDCPSGYVNEWASSVADPTSVDEEGAAYIQSCVPPANACTTCD